MISSSMDPSVPINFNFEASQMPEFMLTDAAGAPRALIDFQAPGAEKDDEESVEEEEDVMFNDDGEVGTAAWHARIWPLIMNEADKEAAGRIDMILKAMPAGVPSRRGPFGNTLLHYAVQKARCATARVLLKHGADANAINDEGRTPLDWAMPSLTYAMIGVLLEAEADPVQAINEAVATGESRALNMILNCAKVDHSVLVNATARLNLSNKDAIVAAWKVIDVLCHSGLRMSEARTPPMCQLLRSIAIADLEFANHIHLLIDNHYDFDTEMDSIDPDSKLTIFETALLAGQNEMCRWYIQTAYNGNPNSNIARRFPSALQALGPALDHPTRGFARLNGRSWILDNAIVCMDLVMAQQVILSFPIDHIENQLDYIVAGWPGYTYMTQGHRVLATMMLAMLPLARRTELMADVINYKLLWSQYSTVLISLLGIHSLIELPTLSFK